MSFLSDLRAQRQKFLDGLDANKDDINLDIFEDFYPDKAHFVYELLQNAEDAEATVCRFILTAEMCIFEHDGKRSFKEDDVRSITGIHNSTKAKTSDKIGKFGVGFKSVFIYSLSPRIYSQIFSFCIRRLVMPEEIPADPDIGSKTRFELRFDNPEKTREIAYKEIENGLNNLSESALLFLQNIQTITWRTGSGSEKSITRLAHSGHHVEILKKGGGMPAKSSHFLRFTHPVQGLEKQNLAIAFPLDLLPAVDFFKSEKQMAKQFRIIPATPGRVAVFFPAEKETSGLRFHLHAPFVPELSRASIKDTPANSTLYEQLAALTVRSLFVIRDLHMLNGEFLAVLPNPDDIIPDKYKCIRESIVTAMNEQPLTPTHLKGHAPATQLLQARLPIKTLLDKSDLEFLVEYEDVPPEWMIGAIKNSETDKFLSGLAKQEWDIEQFVTALEDNLHTGFHYNTNTRTLVSKPNKVYHEWLVSKSDEWHQRFYALLYREFEPEDELGRLEELCIVRLSSGEYSIGCKSYFGTDNVRHDDSFPRVALATYTSGKSKVEQDSARKLLESLGVREVGEVEQVEAILEQRYSKEAKIPDEKTYKSDLKRFISMVETDTKTSKLFRNYWIFEGVDEAWHTPSQIYLDSPYVDTGLSSFFELLHGNDENSSLSDRYQEIGVSKNRLVSFAKAIGAQYELRIALQGTNKHLDQDKLHDDYHARWTNTCINTDWIINHLEEALLNPTVELAKLVWNTMVKTDETVIEAQFRPNQQYPTRTAPSSLIILLQRSEWVPQDGNTFVRPAEASRDLLPEGFPFDPGREWIKAINFGEESIKRLEEKQKIKVIAQELGFENNEALEQGKWFANLDPGLRQRLMTEYKSNHIADLPDHEPHNPERRVNKIREQAEVAPKRETDQRNRAVSVNREDVKKVANPYLVQHYTNGEDVMICQICKDKLPFKRNDGSYYFETVEFLPDLQKHYYQNYLALCPNHAAMFRHANDDEKLISELFLAIGDNYMEVTLAGDKTTIYFTRTHILDLQTVIEVDEQPDS